MRVCRVSGTASEKCVEGDSGNDRAGGQSAFCGKSDAAGAGAEILY